MAIASPIVQAPTTIKKITVTLERWIAAEDNDAGESMNYKLVLLDQNGQRIRWSHEQGNLTPHLTAANEDEQIAIQQNFMDICWAIAEGVLLQ